MRSLVLRGPWCPIILRPKERRSKERNAEPDGGEGKKVVTFPEPGGSYDVHHNVPDGTGDGEFSS